ncbi:MAG: HAMP domain-containing protein [Deltaproteobacteria bacterium]|nr:HAMP domain-containing protein [Deltaproteobacteria bacterium]
MNPRPRNRPERASARRRSLKWGLLLFLGALLFGILLPTGAGVYLFVSRMEQDAWQTRQRESALRAAQVVSGFLERTRDSLALLNLLGARELSSDPQRLRRVVERNPAFREIVRVDAAGGIVATVNQDSPVMANLFTIAQSQWFQTAMRGDFFVGSVELSSFREPYLVMAAPAPDGGVMGLRLRMTVLWDVVAALGFGKTGVAYVVDRGGRVIAHPDRAVILAGTTLRGRPEFEAAVRGGKQGWRGTYFDVQGKKVQGVAAAVPGTSWVMFAELPLTEATAASRTALLFLGGGFLAFGCVATAIAVPRLRNLIFQPLEALREGAARVGDGDLEHRILLARRDEMGELAEAFNEMTGQLRGSRQHLASIAAHLAGQSLDLEERAESTRRGAEEQLSRCLAGSQKAEDVARVLQPLTVVAGGLKEESEQTAASVQQVLAMTQQVHGDMGVLCRRVETAGASVRDLDDTTANVTAVMEQAGAAARSVAASAAAIDRVSADLRGGVGEGRELAEDAAARAVVGRQSMAEALQGMERIRGAVQTAVDCFDRLGAELQRVGQVTQVIQDIAGRTNLLSLNAAIIAAQAGEHGRAFAVVAAEIRSLAEKTSASTRQIQGVVDGVAAGRREAAAAITQGVERVLEGVAAAEKTGAVLEAIHQSSERAAGRLREVDAAADAQAAEASRVSEEIRQITASVASIVDAMRSQQQRTSEIREALAETEEVARDTLSAANEQRQGLESVTRTLTATTRATDEVDSAILNVDQLLAGLRSDVGILDTRARAQLEGVRQLETDARTLSLLAGEIRAGLEGSSSDS